MENKASILIVDDDPGMTETLFDILNETGYDVAVAANGHFAIDMIKERSYDIALMDIKMPGINGVETFEKIKSLSSSTTVIMMTAYSLESLMEESMRKHAYTCLYKPLDIDKVIALVEEITRQKKESGIDN